jgi:hypothetical protein
MGNAAAAATIAAGAALMYTSLLTALHNVVMQVASAAAVLEPRMEHK